MIIFSEHSLLKLKQRNIEKILVIKTIHHPDYTAQGYSNRKIVYKKFEHLYLKVVFMKHNDDYLIITQHWDKNFKPK